MHQKLLILEANEIPLRIFREFARRQPNSAFAQALAEDSVVETIAGDVAEEDLYPSQSWASLNTGRPYRDHRIRWFNDVKCFDDFYWHQMARGGLSTVMVGTLHSSPLGAFREAGNYRVVVPDCFASDGDTLPSRFSEFQDFNLSVTGDNGRTASLGSTLASAAWSFARAPVPSKWGLSRRSIPELGKLGIDALRRNRERLRSAQFPMLAEIFFSSIKRHQPDLGIVFTNHVAATMHRYWYALYPEDYESEIYSQKWIERYQNEIMHAMALLDSWFARLKSFAKDQNYLLVLVTSMGQQANHKLTKDFISINDRDYRLEDPIRLLGQLLGDPARVKVETAMVPQYTYAFDSEEEARFAESQLKEYQSDRACERHGYYLTDEARANGPRQLQGMVLGVERVEHKVTLTVSIMPQSTSHVLIDGREVLPSALGFSALEVDDHHSGCHHPKGSLIAVNDRHGVFNQWRGGEMDYLKFAPTVMDFAGV